MLLKPISTKCPEIRHSVFGFLLHESEEDRVNRRCTYTMAGTPEQATNRLADGLVQRHCVKTTSDNGPQPRVFLACILCVPGH